MSNIYYGYSYGTSLGSIIIPLIIGIIKACILGAVTQTINENKGRDGGFAWGFWLGAIGIIVVACRPAIHYTPTESIIRPEHRAGSPYSPHPSSPHTPTSNSWRCSCGRYNAVYVSSCVCGQNKHQALNVKTAPAAHAPAQPVYVPSTPGLKPPVTLASQSDEYANISVLKEYRALLDAGTITLAEFEAKKNEILSR